MTLARPLLRPVGGVGGAFAMSLDMIVQLVSTRFAFREFIEQSWFVARVSAVPAILLTIPYNVFIQFVFSVVLSEMGAADFTGAGAALAIVTQTGPYITVLIVAGAAATAMSADLGSRTIREEIDAMRTMGINPIQRLVVPRVAAITFNAILLNAVVIIFGLIGAYMFSVYLTNVTPGAFAESLTFLIGYPDVIVAFLKATLFGMAAGVIACYKGITVSGGPQGVGNAVNQTVVYALLCLVVINTVVTSVAAPMTVS
ncbi:ABC transporter permease [Mycobacterium sp. 1274756.6]|uniref:MlaE family ABC transporter permease n=1 Tax=Mycobacterium sp. 1274756.6 TaxID=1834076 RepID=UPI0007FF990F|nr:ABC transporter permease [Mycobacterium sp. 1274756.6]OBJ67832.1 ABC transporter permease [Mycobacterium sp. 1274756.6]